jgi:hypothetical protein
MASVGLRADHPKPRAMFGLFLHPRGTTSATGSAIDTFRVIRVRTFSALRARLGLVSGVGSHFVRVASGGQRYTALAILNRCLASGEIDRAEYEEKRKLIGTVR